MTPAMEFEQHFGVPYVEKYEGRKIDADYIKSTRLLPEHR